MTVRTSATGRTAIAGRDYFKIAPLLPTGGNSPIIIPSSDSDTTTAKKATGIYLADGSFAFAFFLSELQAAVTMMRKYSGSNPGLNVTTTGGKIVFKLMKTGGATIATVTSDTAINDGIEHHIGLVADRTDPEASVLYIYIDTPIDGTPDAQSAPFNDAASIYNTVSLGISAPSGTFSQVMYGTLRDLRHYNRAPSGAEIAQIRAGVNITDGLVHHWEARTPENSLDIPASANSDYDTISRCPATMRRCSMVHEPASRFPVSSSLLMSFGVGADFHYDADALNTVDGVPILDAIPPIFARFNQAAVDFIIVSEIVENYVEADIDAVVGEFDHAKAPIYPIVGNHDDDNGDFAGYINTNHSASVGAECFPDGLSYYSFDVGDGHCVVLDAVNTGDGANQYTMSPTQMAWLEADLLANADKKTVVFIHPRCSGSYAAGVTLKMYEDGAGGAAALRAVLEAAGNVVMVVNGHEHSYHFGKVGGIWYLNVNSVYNNSKNCAIVRIYTDGTVEVERYGPG